MYRSVPMALFLAVALSAAASAQSSFTIPLFFSAGTENDTLTLGVNPGNSVGIDDDTSLGAFRESMAPPTPPPPFAFDARFVTLPGRVSIYPTGLGSGAYKDIRDYRSSNQTDSFKVKIDGDLTENGDVVISWPSDLKNFATVWTIKPQTGSDWPATDMLSASSVTIPAGSQKNIIVIKTGAFVTAAESAAPPAAYRLEQNYPNPFAAGTAISFTLPARAYAQLEVFNILGARVATLAAREFSAGTHSVQFDARALPEGVYLYRFATPSFDATRRLHIVR